jgi:hypothetical protein
VQSGCADDDHLFIKLLRQFTEPGSNISDKKSPTCAPPVFAEQPEAKPIKATGNRSRVQHSRSRQNRRYQEVAKGRGGIEGNAASKRSEGGGSIVTVHADRKNSERRSKSIVLTVSNGCSGVTDRPCSILFIHSSPQE